MPSLGIGQGAGQRARAATSAAGAGGPRCHAAGSDRRSCSRRGAETLVVPTDADRRRVRQWSAADERVGRIDVLVNNAGRAIWARFDQLADVSTIEEILARQFPGRRLLHAPTP